MSSASAALRLMMDLMPEWKSTMTVSVKMLVLLCLSVYCCHWQTWCGASLQWGLTLHVSSFHAPLQKLWLVGTCSAAQWSAHSAGDGDCELAA